MFDPATVGAVDAVIKSRLEDVRARLYDERAANNPMAWKMRIAWRDHMITTVMRSDMPE